LSGSAKHTPYLSTTGTSPRCANKPVVTFARNRRGAKLANQEAGTASGESELTRASSRSFMASGGKWPLNLMRCAME
jgi:hypothetical protein